MAVCRVGLSHLKGDADTLRNLRTQAICDWRLLLLGLVACGKHGVSQEEIEEVFAGSPSVMADPFPGEPRMRAIGRTRSGRHVFLVFVIRESNGVCKLRPVSARYMHHKEILHYEQQNWKA